MTQNAPTNGVDDQKVNLKVDLAETGPGEPVTIHHLDVHLEADRHLARLTQKSAPFT